MPSKVQARYMSLKEFRQLRESARYYADRDNKAGRVRGVLGWMVVDLATSTGLRVGEISQLRVGDVDFRRKLLRIHRLKAVGNPEQYLPMDPSLADHLFEFIKWKYRRGEHILAESALFCGKRGPITNRGLQRVWHRARELAGLPEEISIRSARHTLAVHELRRTGNIQQVQRKLGHANAGTTANMYLELCRAADLLDAMEAGDAETPEAYAPPTLTEAATMVAVEHAHAS